MAELLRLDLIFPREIQLCHHLIGCLSDDVFTNHERCNKTIITHLIGSYCKIFPEGVALGKYLTI